MQKILLLTLLLCVPALTGCKKVNNDTNTITDSENYAIFASSYDISFMFEEAERYAPSDEDIQNGIKILENNLKNNKKILGLEQYKIQFFGYFNKNSEKMLWANYFCNIYETDWQNNVVLVKDGGNCYFNARVNLDKKEVESVVINGEG